MIFVTFGDGLDRIVDGFRRHYNAPEEDRISMADFPDNWALARALEEGGQGQTFVVRRADGSDLQEYVLKRLKNPNREEYFEREIQACETLDHPNVLRVLEHGRTPRGKRYLVTEYCKGGTLGGDGPRFDNPGDGLRFFRQIVAGVAHAHSNVPAVYHLDLKPENIFLKDGAPVIGDFGICFIAEDELSITKEGMRGSKYYCAPEFRNPKIEGNPRPESADVYSLGKILYWLFAREVYDGHEEDYVASEKSWLASLFTTDPRFAFIDELIAETVRRSPAERIANASLLFQRVQQVVDRIEAGGRVLDLRVPQRCLY